MIATTKWFLLFIGFLSPLPVWASSLEQATASPGMTTAKWGMITTCFLLGILKQLASGALEGDVRFQWGHLLARLLFVVLFIHSAGTIQGSFWGAAQSVGDQLMPGPTLADMNRALEGRIEKIKDEGKDKTDTTAEEDSWNPKTLGKNIASDFFNRIYEYLMKGLEMLALSAFFIFYKFLQSAQNCVMMFLAAMVPFIIPPSIIPGVNTWSSWLKMVISVALWPVVAGFLIKGHLSSASSWIAGSESTPGGPIGVFTGDAQNFFLNMDSLGLLAEAVVYAFMLLSAPFLSAALVYGSAPALGMGVSLIAAGGLGYLRSGIKSLTSSPQNPSQGEKSKPFEHPGNAIPTTPQHPSSGPYSPRYLNSRNSSASRGNKK